MMDDFWLVLGGMTCITFSCRYLFLSRLVSFELSPKIKRALSFTAPAVLTAMWVPIVFLGHQSSEVAFLNSPFLYAGLLTVLLSLKIKNTLAVVFIGMCAFMVFRLTL
ncbi:AzlD domain-containing protein [Moritella yayanosii]|uniref:Putative membrane protein n=1 Tax=Moritella yayanosii TaxID=69539 RepID=A0A330LWN0_9GAMM|nr:AzlD domain-containing protein [Moritella yayanosii]SQD78505.1 putative membrane protein [Moritella yayanosii]